MLCLWGEVRVRRQLCGALSFHPRVGFKHGAQTFRLESLPATALAFRHMWLTSCLTVPRHDSQQDKVASGCCAVLDTTTA